MFLRVFSMKLFHGRGNETEKEGYGILLAKENTIPFFFLFIFTL